MATSPAAMVTAEEEKTQEPEMAAREIELQAGALLFSENEPSDHVAFLLSGEVEVFRTLGAHEVVLAVLGPGEYVGEMGVLEGRRRAASVRARSDVRVRFLDRQEFVSRVVREPELARELLLRLSERLRRTDERLVALVETHKGRQVAAANRPEIRLFPGTPELARWIPPEGLLLRRLPFTVGRRPAPDERAPEEGVDLALPDGRPYRLSRRHFAIVLEADGVYLVDRDSRLGTIVDELPLGEIFARTRTRLGPGEHEVVAGGLRSPWRFRIRVEEAAAAADAQGATTSAASAR
ncbi:putative ABC transporter ATP-binding protein [bacterium HR40]|nr:putative ABC transporter ATP-binding protein [bacterium HR40]